MEIFLWSTSGKTRNLVTLPWLELLIDVTALETCIQGLLGFLNLLALIAESSTSCLADNTNTRFSLGRALLLTKVRNPRVWKLYTNFS